MSEAKAKPSAGVVHYRPEQFITAPFEILTDHLLTDGDRRMLLALCSFAIGKSVLWPSRETLALRAGIDISNVSKRVRRLVDLGWVTTKQRGKHSNKYFLHIPQRLTASPEALAASEALWARQEADATADAAYSGPFDDAGALETDEDDDLFS